MASLQSTKGWRMLFIMVWKVAGKLHNPKNMKSGSKSLQFIEKAAFHSSPLSQTLLKPSRVVNHSASCSLVRTLEINRSIGGFFHDVISWYAVCPLHTPPQPCLL